jgi:hypothetical protein
MATVSNQSSTHALNPVKHWGAELNNLDFAARISANVQYSMPAGRVAHINAAGELEPGVSCARMGLFMFQGANSLDVDNTNYDQWTPLTPSGRVNCLVATGGYELESTEFDTARTYAPNQVLTAPTGTSSGSSATSGVLTNNATVYVDAICGVVSRGVFTNVYRKTVLAFWPVYIPVFCSVDS